MKKVIGVILLLITVFAFIRYTNSDTIGDASSAIGEFIPIALIGIIGAYLTFGKGMSKN
jgi:hypothetical protein